MKRGFCAVLVLLFILFSPVSVARAEVRRHPMLDCALTMLEKNNLFLLRYNEITGADLEAVFDEGVPYFFGGIANDYMFSMAPRYRTFACWLSSDYFKKDQYYCYGLDCAGFTQMILSRCGMPRHDTLENMILNWWQYEQEGHHLFNQRPGHEMPVFDQLKDTLQVGDFFVARHTGAKYRHIMMYIGTPRDFGFTAENAPELAAYLDFPLVIHCGLSPVYGERIQQYMDARPEIYQGCNTTDGGVQVSILGVRPEDAPIHRHVQNTDYAYFLLDDGRTVLTVWDAFDVSSYCWFRM